ncbi:MAG TPA: tripartite tricarboxylate transporter substrate binding protein [Paracoccaceae bacterium]|nr:tripartite tricarboxylate transporter substrate binding protein [Paracoccaceae bacterium]
MAQSAEVPCETARLIVPWKAGGDTHVLYSIFEETIQRLDVKPKIKVVTIPGQGGNKGAKEAAEADPDGCTLFAIHQSAITSYLNGRIDFHYNKFEPVALLTSTPDILGAAADTPWNSWDEFEKDVLANPGKYKVGATFGSTSQFMWIMLEEKTGMEFDYVPYEGTRERITAMLSGAIDLGSINVATAQQYIKDDALKALAIADEERTKRLPDLPTLKEKGVDLVFSVRRGVMAPPGTPDDVVAMWADIFQKAATDPDLLKQMDAKGTDIKFLGPQEFQNWIDRTFDAYKNVAINIGMYKPEE